jgi:hypothetical protein
MPTKKAAIDFEKIMETPLNAISAADFLTALEQNGQARHLMYWPEKKKYELFLEPERLPEITIGRLIDILKGEKKKAELEKLDPGEYVKRTAEDVLDPQERFVFDSLAQRLNAVEASLNALQRKLG